MGTIDSKERLGERVRTARRKLEEDKKMQSERANEIRSKSPATMKAVLQSIEESFKTCSPFLEASLLLAWEFDPDKCKSIVLNAAKKVLREPIKRNEWEWFHQC